MKIQRYNPDEIIYDFQLLGEWCQSEDVEKLEQLNAEMLEVLKGVSYQEEYADDYEFIDFEKVKSIIEKVEAMK